MRMCARLIVAATLLASTLAAATPPTPAAVDELMHKSGMWRQLADVAALFVQGVDKAAAQQAPADQATAAAMRSAFLVAYGPDRLRPAVARELALVLSAEELDAALQWLASDTGVGITKLEEDAAAADAAQDRSDIADALAAGLAPERRARYQRLARAMHSGEVGALMMINMTYGLAQGMRAATPGSPGRDPEEMRAALEAVRPQLVAVSEKRGLATMAITYATLPDADLDRYIAFAESPAGGRYNAAATIALDKALTAGATEAGRLLVQSRST